jgi:hypothetical protein
MGFTDPLKDKFDCKTDQSYMVLLCQIYIESTLEFGHIKTNVTVSFVHMYSSYLPTFFPFIQLFEFHST